MVLEVSCSSCLIFQATKHFKILVGISFHFSFTEFLPLHSNSFLEFTFAFPYILLFLSVKQALIYSFILQIVWFIIYLLMQKREVKLSLQSKAFYMLLPVSRTVLNGIPCMNDTEDVGKYKVTHIIIFDFCEGRKTSF